MGHASRTCALRCGLRDRCGGHAAHGDIDDMRDGLVGGLRLGGIGVRRRARASSTAGCAGRGTVLGIVHQVRALPLVVPPWLHSARHARRRPRQRANPLSRFQKGTLRFLRSMQRRVPHRRHTNMWRIGGYCRRSRRRRGQMRFVRALPAGLFLRGAVVERRKAVAGRGRGEVQRMRSMRIRLSFVKLELFRRGR